MKLKTDSSTFLAAVKRVSGAIDKRPSIPILGGISVEAIGKNVSLTATDLHKEVSVMCSAEILEEGLAVIEGARLQSALAALPKDKDLTLFADKESAAMQCGRGRYKFAAFSPQDYPRIELGEIESGRATLTVSASKFAALLDSVSFAAAQNDARYYLNGVYLEICERGLIAVGTDGHRLAYAELACDMETPGHCIVPVTALPDLVKLLKSKDEVSLSITPNFLHAYTEGARIACKLVQGKFPDYQRVIPPSSDNPIMIEKGALLGLLERAKPFASDKYTGIRLEIASKELTIHAQNPTGAESTEGIELDREGDHFEAGYNVDYLIPAVKAIASDSVCLHYSDSQKPLLILPQDGNAHRCVVMPMRL